MSTGSSGVVPPRRLGRAFGTSVDLQRPSVPADGLFSLLPEAVRAVVQPFLTSKWVHTHLTDLVVWRGVGVGVRGGFLCALDG